MPLSPAPRASFEPVRVRRVRLAALLAVLIACLSGAVLPAASATAEPVAAAQPGTVAVDFAWADINGSGRRTSAAIMSRSVRARFVFEKWVWTRTAEGAPVVARLQRRIGTTGSWRSTGQTVSTRSSVFDVRIRPYSLDPAARDVTVHYRLVVPTGGGVRRGDASPSVRFDYQNWHRYTGLKRTLYGDMRRFCPDLAIRSETRYRGWAGLTPVGLYETRILTRVGTFRAVNRRAVMLHECAHHLQWQKYGASSAGRTRMQQQAAAIFGTNSSKPVEHMADCVAQAANPGGYLGYGGRCTPTQLRAAARFLGLAAPVTRHHPLTAQLAFALMAAVGYGDPDPVTFARRFTALARIAWGLGLLGFVGALLAAWFVGRARRGSEASVVSRSRGTFRILSGSILTGLAGVWLLSSIATDPAFGGGTIAGIAVSLPVLNVGLLLLVQGRNQRRRFRAIPLDRIR